MNEIKHLKRWTLASIIKTLRPLLEQGFDMFVEGDDRFVKLNPKHFELRVDGPYIYPIGAKGEYRAYIEVNLLGNVTRDESNRYTRQNMQGFLTYLLNRDFCIWKTGNQGKDPADDGTMFETFVLKASDQIKLSDFGQIDTSVQVFQCVAEAHYEMYFAS